MWHQQEGLLKQAVLGPSPALSGNGWSPLGWVSCTTASVSSVVIPWEIGYVCLFKKTGIFLQLSKQNELQNFRSSLNFALSREVQGQWSHWFVKSTIHPAHFLSFFFWLIPLKPMPASAWSKWSFTFGGWILVRKVCGVSYSRRWKQCFSMNGHELIFPPPKQKEK